MADQIIQTTTVPVESAWLSKINWTQVVAGVAMLATFLSGGKFNLDATQQLAIVTTIGIVSSFVTFIMRTWFNNRVSPASIPVGQPVQTTVVEKK